MSSSVALRHSPWDVVPSLNNLEAYLAAIRRMPLLTPDEERSCGVKLRESGDVDAASRLVLSHLRLVASIARQYLGYGLPHGDLIQEGNIGLMKAVRRFDPDEGGRLVSYALHWIKAEIHEYILRNARMVKVASTKPQRKLYFKLRSLKQAFKNHAGDGQTQRQHLSVEEVEAVAQQLQVKPEEVREMEVRLAGGDVPLEPSEADEDDGHVAPLAYLADENSEPTRVLQAFERDYMASVGVERALATLDARSRHIIEQRWIHVGSEPGTAVTLQDLGRHYGVSAERIRQLEAAALKKMREAMLA